MSARFVDEVPCPLCGCRTLVTDPVMKDGEVHRYRYCSFVRCDWGLGGHDVLADDAPVPAARSGQ